METMKYTCAQSFISMCIIVVGKFEKGRSDFKENCLRLFVVGGCHGNYRTVADRRKLRCIMPYSGRGRSMVA